jgi:hypothetical protein
LQVAIKRTLRLSNNRAEESRALRELTILFRFGDHPNIPELLDVMITPRTEETPTDFDTSYIVTPLFGYSLLEVINSSEPLTQHQVRSFTYQVRGHARARALRKGSFKYSGTLTSGDGFHLLFPTRIRFCSSFKCWPTYTT